MEPVSSQGWKFEDLATPDSSDQSNRPSRAAFPVRCWPTAKQFVRNHFWFRLLDLFFSFFIRRSFLLFKYEKKCYLHLTINLLAT